MTAPRFFARLLVDGYNMIGAWPDLKQLQHQEGLDAARDRLIEQLINYAAWQDFQTQVVFDAYARREKAYTEAYTPHLSVHYTDYAQTADAYIEKSCAHHARQVTRKRLIVATSDYAQQQTASGYGAECLSARQLAIAVQQSNRRRVHRDRKPKQSSRRFLFSGLDPQAQQRLSQLRFGKL
ncbi:NYN domain-containing protein [Spirulina major CS-329]|jgi:predicted RNA-binding protein with PIN domain|uniref:NYN domain-containing protein n=1 Tax=Spirulina TaxID=1154 RepID=UPI0023300C9D|nr:MULTISPECIES: NYN domain-containing protein [Spirulina]MDB9494473.1 NYN domain-containing protein [Spirulina subsalsa CS-330]MDB9503301.1 NYN domain-containing protein [Spirulina major CS-329]